MTLLPMENKESILCALKSFEKDRPITIPPILEDYIKQIARDGRTMLPWVYIKPLLLHKFNIVVDSLVADCNVPDFLPLSNAMTLRQNVYNTLKRLDGIPFTIQRICEMLENPFRHYNRPDKYLRGMEKVCTVVSTVDPEGNKIYHEDPRFPSRAGLDQFNALTSDGLLLSPPSPCVDHLHRPQNSKSSDVDVITDDDDENEEDEEDDDGTESSSHGSCTPPRGVSSLATQSSALSTACDSGPSWPFGAGRLTLPPASKSQFRDSTPEKPSTAGDCPTDFVHQKVDEVVSSSTVEESDTESHIGKEHVDGRRSPSSLASPPSTLADEGRHANRSSTNDFCPIATTTLSFSESDSSSASTTQTSIETESSVAVVLRPIGQLEAFVQNVVGADASYPISSSGLLARTPSGSIFNSDDHSNAIATSQGHTEEIAVSETDRVSICGTKRPASSGCDSVLEESVNRMAVATDGTLSPPNHHQSPAKRRRLAEVSPTSPDCDLRMSASVSPSIALNDSPPIILCVPNSQTRDHVSEENTRFTDVADSVSPTRADDLASVERSYEHDDRSSSSSVSSSEIVHSHNLIDSETGEVEEQH